MSEQISFQKRLIRFILPIAIIGMSVLGVFLLDVEEKKVTETEIPERVWPVEVQVVDKGTVTPSVQLNGQVVSSRTSQFSSILSARVLKVNVRPGYFVEKGDVLVEFDTRNIQTRLDLLEAETQRINAQIDFEHERHVTNQQLLTHELKLLEIAQETMDRVGNLTNRNLDTQSSFEAAQKTVEQFQTSVVSRRSAIESYQASRQNLEAQLRRGEAARENAKRDFEKSRITAPYAGRVSKVHVAFGNQVSNGSPILEIFDHKAVEVRALVPVQYLERLRTSSSQNIRLSALSKLDGAKIPLEFDRLSATIDSSRGGVDAFLSMADPEAYPELGRELTFTLSLLPVDDALTIPFQAVYGSDQVFKVEDGTLKSILIERFGQITIDGKQLIVARSAELARGDLLMVTPLTSATEGLRVEPIPVG